ncbi:MAG: hypothetical protein ACLFU9_03120 [Candidatus Bathyarchaeia archaeon]
MMNRKTEETRRAGFQEGYCEGYDEGYHEGLEEGISWGFRSGRGKNDFVKIACTCGELVFHPYLRGAFSSEVQIKEDQDRCAPAATKPSLEQRS